MASYFRIVFIVLVAVLLPACTKPPQPAQVSPTPTVEQPHTSQALFLSQPRLRANPVQRAPLVFIVDLDLAEDADLCLQISELGTQVQREQKQSVEAGPNSLAILELHPSQSYQIQVEAKTSSGQVYRAESKLQFSTPALPDDFPPLSTDISRPELMEPGVCMFAVNLWQDDVSLVDYGYLIATDNTGQVVWYCHTTDRVADFKVLGNGNILYQHGSYRYLYEIDILGRDLRSWYAARSVQAPNENSIPVDVDTLHHDTLELPNGNFLALATELRKFERYPVDEFSSPIEYAPAWVVCDEIVEFQPATGQIVQRFALTDILDCNRFGYLCNNPFWKDKYDEFIDSPCRDWSHANAMQLLQDGSLLISFRHLDCVIKLNWNRKKIEWIFGNALGWASEFEALLLKAQGNMSWPYHQHSPHMTSSGRLLMFDNGNFRTVPGYGQPTQATANASRIVAYQIDEPRRTVREVFSYGAAEGDQFYSPFYGEAEILPQTKNLLVVDGGHVETNDGKPHDAVPGDRQWARIFELSSSSKPQKMFELTIASPMGSDKGWSIYRGNRYPSLSNPFAVRVPKPSEKPIVYARDDIRKLNPLNAYAPKSVENAK